MLKYKKPIRWLRSFVIGMLIAGEILACASSTGCSGNQKKVLEPSVVIPEPEKDLGIVLPGSEIKTKFKVLNQGESPLEITDIKTSCGCTSAIASPQVIAPHEEGALTVIFQVPTQKDFVSHNVLFRTNDPNHKQLVVGFSAKPKWRVSVRPGSLELSVVKVGEVIERELEVFSPRDLSFTIENIDANLGCIKVESERLSPMRYALMVRVVPERIGRMRGEIRIQTNLSNSNTMRIPLDAHVIAESSISPEKILLGTRERGSTASTSIEVAGEINMEMLNVKVEADGWNAQVTSVIDASVGTKRLLINIKLPDKLGYAKSHLRIETEPKNRSVSIPVSCYLIE